MSVERWKRTRRLVEIVYWIFAGVGVLGTAVGVIVAIKAPGPPGIVIALYGLVHTTVFVMLALWTRRWTASAN